MNKEQMIIDKEQIFVDKEQMIIDRDQIIKFQKQNKIKEMMNKKQFKYAKQATLKYLEEHPNSHQMKNLLGIIYLIEGDYDKADGYFTSSLGTKDENYAKYFLIKIAIERGEYDLAYEYCCDTLKLTTDPLTRKDIHRAERYIKTLYGINRVSEIGNNYKDNYFGKQIEEYNLEEAYKHILKHQEPQKPQAEELDQDDYHVQKKIIAFNPDIDLKQLLIEVSEKIQHMEEVCYPIRLAGNCYYFYYPNIGKDGDETTDYFRVITFPNSKNIITMYPIFPEEVYDIKNTVHFLDETEDFTYDENIKARTGLERFNTRYKRR